jgi:S1-C subfamily serine protease
MKKNFYILVIVLSLYSLTHRAHAQAQISTSAAASSQVSVGTGFVVAEGFLLTAQHVLRGQDSIWVGPIEGRQWVRAEVVKFDNQLDLALISAKVSARPLSFASWADVPTGLEVTAIGYPQPKLQGLSKKITQGLINGNRSDRNESFDAGFFQFSAEVQIGNSGGPVFSPDGLVVGMVQKKLNALDVAERTKDLPVNVSYGLKSSEILNFLKGTPVEPNVKSISLNTNLRPYQIFAQQQSSVLAVVGRKNAAALDQTRP